MPRVTAQVALSIRRSMTGESAGINIYGSPRPFLGGEGLGVRGRNGGPLVIENSSTTFRFFATFPGSHLRTGVRAIRPFTQPERDSWSATDPLLAAPSPPTPPTSLPQKGPKRGEGSHTYVACSKSRRYRSARLGEIGNHKNRNVIKNLGTSACRLICRSREKSAGVR